MTPQEQAEATVVKKVAHIVEQKTEKYQKQGESKFTSEEIFHALNSNEDGDAWLFINLFRNCFVYDHAAGRWYEFKGHSWAEDEINDATAAIEDVINTYGEEVKRQGWLRLKVEKAGQTEKAGDHEALEKALIKRIRDLQSSRRKQNVLHLASVGRSSLAISGREWDQHPMLLACLNGVVDLKTGRHRPGRAGDFLKSVSPIPWQDIDTPARMWEKFLYQIFHDDNKIVAYIQRLLGYSITGKATEHIYPICFGKGRNGKGTLFETLNSILGKLAGPIEAEMILSQRYARQSGGPTSDIMALRGKRLVWSSEIEEGRRLNTGRLKWLTGGDTLTGRAPFGKRQVTFQPMHTLFLLTNHRPQAPANDYALWARLHLIPFTQAFVEHPVKGQNEFKADPNLLDKLKSEGPGILAWLVRGCLEWQRQGLNPPEAVKSATANYRKDEDLIGQFISECCVVMPHVRIKAGELLKAYKEWCDEGSTKPLPRDRFASQMLDRFDRDESGRYRFYIGVGLKNEE